MSQIGPINKAEWERRRRENLADGISFSKISDVLLPYQAKLLRTTVINQVTVVEKSRRTGLTWAAAADAVLTAAGNRKAGGKDVLYIGYNLDMAREFIDTCAMWAKAFSTVTVEDHLFKDGKEDESIQAFRIHFDSGYEICALSSKPRSLRGRQGYVIIDEAAFHDDLPELLKAALALLIWGGKVLIISTHDGEDNSFNQLCEDIRKGRKPYALLTIDFDQALHDGLYQRICQRQGNPWSAEAEAKWREEIVAFYGDAADEELYLIPTKGSGAYLPAHLLDRARMDGIPIIRHEFAPEFVALSEAVRTEEVRKFCEERLLPPIKAMPPAFNSFVGMDIGRSGDPSCIWPGQIVQNMSESIPFIVELRDAPFSVQRQILWFIQDNVPRFTRAAIDASGHGSQLAEETAQKYGQNRILEIKIGPGWYETELPPFKRDFEDGLARIPMDLDVYNDHRAVKLVRGKPFIERNPDDKARKVDGAKGKKTRHGDSAIAHILARIAARLEVREYGYISGRDQAKEHNPHHDDDPDHDDVSGRFGHGAW